MEPFEWPFRSVPELCISGHCKCIIEDLHYLQASIRSGDEAADGTSFSIMSRAASGSVLLHHTGESSSQRAQPLL